MGGSSSYDEWEFASSATRAWNIVLVGRTGNGKSATFNSIIGRKEFTSKASSAGVTKTCELKTTVLNDGQILNVIDTPGLFDSSANFEFIGKEIVKCIKMAEDGIHAVLIVLSVRTRFSEEEEKALCILQNLFGKKIIDYMIVIFTNGDGLEDDDETLEDYLGRDCPESLKEILYRCENRRVLFNNSTKDEAKKAEQRRQLLSLVNKVMAKNSAQPFTDELFTELKRGEMKLRNQAEEVNSLEGYTKSELTELREQMHKSYEEQRRGITEMVELKVEEAASRLEQQLAEEQAELKEATSRLEQQLAEEQAARLKAEESAEKAREKSNDEIRKLRESLERAQQETEELRNKQSESGGCNAQKAQENSNVEISVEIRKLIETLDRAQQETEQLRNKQSQSGGCIIL